MFDVIESFDGISEGARAIASDSDSLERFCQLRSRYTIEVCISLWDMLKDTVKPEAMDTPMKHVGGMLGRPGCVTFLRLNSTMSELSRVDSLLETTDTFVSTWEGVLEAVVRASPAVPSSSCVKRPLQSALAAFSKRIACFLSPSSRTETVEALVPSDGLGVVTAPPAPSKLTSSSVWQLLTYNSVEEGETMYGNGEHLEAAGLPCMSSFLLTYLVAHVEAYVKQVVHKDFM
jgi:hypothetical protein